MKVNEMITLISGETATFHGDHDRLQLQGVEIPVAARGSVVLEVNEELFIFERHVTQFNQIKISYKHIWVKNSRNQRKLLLN